MSVPGNRVAYGQQLTIHCRSRNFANHRPPTELSDQTTIRLSTETFQLEEGIGIRQFRWEHQDLQSPYCTVELCKMMGWGSFPGRAFDLHQRDRTDAIYTRWRGGGGGFRCVGWPSRVVMVVVVVVGGGSTYLSHPTFLGDGLAVGGVCGRLLPLNRPMHHKDPGYSINKR